MSWESKGTPPYATPRQEIGPLKCRVQGPAESPEDTIHRPVLHQQMVRPAEDKISGMAHRPWSKQYHIQKYRHYLLELILGPSFGSISMKSKWYMLRSRWTMCSPSFPHLSSVLDCENVNQSMASRSTFVEVKAWVFPLPTCRSNGWNGLRPLGDCSSCGL